MMRDMPIPVAEFLLVGAPLIHAFLVFIDFTPPCKSHTPNNIKIILYKLTSLKE